MSVLVTNPNNLYFVCDIPSSSCELATGDLYTAKKYLEVSVPSDKDLDSVCEAFTDFLSGVGYPMLPNERVELVRSSKKTHDLKGALETLATSLGDYLYDPEPQANAAFDSIGGVQLQELEYLVNVAMLNLRDSVESKDTIF